MSRFLRRNAISLAAIFFVLSSGAYAVSKATINNSDLATGAVDSRTLRAGAVEEKNLADGAVGATKLNLDKLAKYVQMRVADTCPAGQKVQGFLVDGGVLCVDDGVSPGSITGITTSGGLTGEGSSGVVDIGRDPTLLQSRIDGACPGGQAVRSVAQDGSPVCGPQVSEVDSGLGLTGGPVTGTGTIAADPTVLQQRANPTTCPFGGVQGLGATGTPDCVQIDVTNNSGYVQLNDNPSQSSNILNFGGVIIRATCLNGGNGQIEVGSSGPLVNFQIQSTSSGVQAGAVSNGGFATISNTATNDLGRYNVTTNTGVQVDGTFLNWSIATTGGIDCVFNTSALTFSS